MNITFLAIFKIVFYIMVSMSLSSIIIISIPILIIGVYGFIKKSTKEKI